MPEGHLGKKLTTFGLTMIAVGSCIGSGIFKTPSSIADHLGDSTLIIAVWVIGGLVAVSGALTFSELGFRFPKTGGVFVYLQEAYGDLVAFLYGWTLLTVVTSGAIAALSLVFASYASYLFPVGPLGEMMLGIGAIIVVTIINVLSVKGSESLANVLTLLKLFGILLIVGIGVFYGNNSETTSIAMSTEYGIWSAFAGAMVGVFWSYGGWHHASYLSGETPNPKKSIPRAMIIGAIIVTVMYVLANVAYLKLLSPAQMSASSAVASDALFQVTNSASVIVAILIIISTLGTIGIYTLSAPRIYFTMAREGMFFDQLARIHPKYNTPLAAIVFQSVWAIILILLWQSFENLITYVVFMDWVFMIMAAFSIFLFRKKLGILKDYKVPLYPLTPLIFIVISVAFIVFTIIGKPSQAWAGIILMLLGLPVFYFFKKSSTRS